MNRLSGCPAGVLEKIQALFPVSWRIYGVELEVLTMVTLGRALCFSIRTRPAPELSGLTGNVVLRRWNILGILLPWGLRDRKMRDWCQGTWAQLNLNKRIATSAGFVVPTNDYVAF